MIIMLLKMSALVAAHIIITVLLYRSRRDRPMTRSARIGIGVIYGLCAIASTHSGVNYGDAVLNVRDLAPLSAGLFFDPVSGIIAGFIGGVERYIAGTWFGVEEYTRIACTFATCMAGVWAAVLRKVYFRESIPQLFDAFFMGAAMEVFHMYAIFFTVDGTVEKVFRVVNSQSGPMIFFTGAGLAVSSAAVTIASGQGRSLITRRDKREIPLYETFQFWLTFFSISVFCFNFGLSSGLQTGKAGEEAAEKIMTAAVDIRDEYGLIVHTKTDISKLNIHVGGGEGGFDIFDSRNRVIAGTHLGKRLSNRRLSQYRTRDVKEVFSERYFAIDSLCVTDFMDDGNLLVVFLPKSEVYEHRDIQNYQSIFSNILVLTLILVLTSIVARRIIVSKMDDINASLHQITEGNLDEKVSVYTSLEFALMSDDVNTMVNTLEGYIDEAEKRVEQELQSARTIQESALPKNFDLPRDDVGIYASMTPAKAVGGDFYDFFFVNNNTFAMVIADVSGKGIPASLFMMRSKQALRTTAERGGSPAEILATANRTLCEGNSAHMFVSVWIGLIDLDTGVMRCANAGHEYPCFRKSGSRFFMIQDEHSPVLALFKRSKPVEYELHFSPGDRIFVYTDGIPEAIDNETKAYGEERLISILNQTGDLPLNEALDGILMDINAFAAGTEQFDDITMLAFEYRGNIPNIHKNQPNNH